MKIQDGIHTLANLPIAVVEEGTAVVVLGTECGRVRVGGREWEGKIESVRV